MKSTEQLIEMLQSAPDARGECDRCHSSPRDLWIIDDDDPGEFAYCRPCVQQIVTKRQRGSTTPLRKGSH